MACLVRLKSWCPSDWVIEWFFRICSEVSQQISRNNWLLWKVDILWRSDHELVARRVRLTVFAFDFDLRPSFHWNPQKHRSKTSHVYGFWRVVVDMSWSCCAHLRLTFHKSSRRIFKLDVFSSGTPSMTTRACSACHCENNITIQILFSFSSDKDRRTDSRIRRNKHSAAPPGIKPRVLQILVARSYHWASKPQRELRVNSRLSPSCQFFFREENLIRNVPDKSEFTNIIIIVLHNQRLHRENQPFRHQLRSSQCNTGNRWSRLLPDLKLSLSPISIIFIELPIFHQTWSWLSLFSGTLQDR